METDNPARTLLLEESFGVLSTISVDVKGYPFGSVTPYCMDRMGRPVIYISPIAQHTRNIAADSRVSLTVMEKAASDDVQAQGRLTYIANAIAVDAEPTIAERYFRYFPSARQYEDTHSFTFFRLEPVRIRFIGGFGQIFWMTPEEFSKANPFSEADERRIVEHMNQDHGETLSRLAAGRCVMAGLDAEGFDVLQEGRKLRIPFPAPVHTMAEARQTFVEMARRTQSR